MDGRDEGVGRLEEVIGEFTMRSALLRDAKWRLARGVPLGLRRSMA
jgi:hypothetical protein